MLNRSLTPSDLGLGCLLGMVNDILICEVNARSHSGDDCSSPSFHSIAFVILCDLLCVMSVSFYSSFNFLDSRFLLASHMTISRMCVCVLMLCENDASCCVVNQRTKLTVCPSKCLEIYIHRRIYRYGCVSVPNGSICLLLKLRYSLAPLLFAVCQFFFRPVFFFLLLSFMSRLIIIFTTISHIQTGHRVWFNVAWNMHETTKFICTLEKENKFHKMKMIRGEIYWAVEMNVVSNISMNL